MHQIDIRTSKPPYGMKVVVRRDGIHLQMKTKLGAESYVLLPRDVAEFLRDELNAALVDAPMQIEGTGNR